MSTFARLVRFTAMASIALALSGTAVASPYTPPNGSGQPGPTVPPGGGITHQDDDVDVPAHLRRQVVAYQTREAAGTVVIDTPNTYLYYVLGNGRAIRYGIGVGREGFTWAGTQSVSRKAEWPDWHPPAEMIERQPYLPRFMAGGPGNPLGARAMYLGGTIYRIHGTNQPATIGGRVSSGCIRMTNDDVTDLYARVNVGTKVVVLPAGPAQRVAEPVRATAPVAQPAMVNSYAPVRPSPAAAVWREIRPSGLY